jgi:hypothetical protein
MIESYKMYFIRAKLQSIGAVIFALCAGQTFAQVQPNFPGLSAQQPTTSGARFLESCQQNIEQGISSPACQGAVYIKEINNLKEEALRTNAPELFTLLGDAYKNNDSPIADVSQAYRWYLLAAVRGDARAMQRLAELYQDGGKGVPQDKVKAAGYERLARRLSGGNNPAPIINKLGSEMAIEETALAQRFADEFAKIIQRPPSEAAQKRDAGKDKRDVSKEPVPAVPLPINATNIPGAGAVQQIEKKPAIPVVPNENENFIIK